MSTRTAPDRYLEVNGVRLRWRLDGSGPALALLHGWALDLAYWNFLVAALAGRFTMLRFDRRGFGLSEGLPDIHRNVADLQALLAEAHIERVVLVGMSQGARLAIHFACRHPTLVRGLVLDGAPAFDAEPDLPLDQYREVLDAAGLEAMQAQILAHPMMRLNGADREARQLLEQMLARYRGLDLLHPVGHAAAPDTAALNLPTLILNGSLDSPARLEAGRSLRAGIAGARQVILPGAGHLALLDDPASYLAAVGAFCDALPP
jgi:3-oxoadipate enol-lactonase